jgi:hypothetical protein
MATDFTLGRNATGKYDRSPNDYTPFKILICARIDEHLSKNRPLPDKLIEQLVKLGWTRTCGLVRMVKQYNRQIIQLKKTRAWVNDRTTFGWFFSSSCWISHTVATQLNEHNETIEELRDFINTVKHKPPPRQKFKRITPEQLLAPTTAYEFPEQSVGVTLGCSASGESDHLTPDGLRPSQSMIRLRQDLTPGVPLYPTEQNRTTSDLTPEEHSSSQIMVVDAIEWLQRGEKV